VQQLLSRSADKRVGGNLKEGGGSGYAVDILDCEKCLKRGNSGTRDCVSQIRSRLLERGYASADV